MLSNPRGKQSMRSSLLTTRFPARRTGGRTGGTTVCVDAHDPPIRCSRRLGACRDHSVDLATDGARLGFQVVSGRKWLRPCPSWTSPPLRMQP